ncbi:SRPBCC family protein [Adhaeribacter radiodurans]|uniref:SRPBCC family protein n=1 Tax=Adhaeribacter radiodurans TaxID=2745197 RepID=A0A7L7L7K3_9BACT|nr:SRPBCC family protein [Adhaeribacter radiodurans]QMU28734.1 SRPBCC family protein [Adhaeribacter radiodurans]
MSHYVLKRTHKLPITLDQAWDFFSSPDNLAEITPSYMGFEVLSNSDSTKMYPGQIITYYVKPLFGIKIFWMTEITHVADKQYFVDEQRFGPYALWHHSHFFKEIPGGVEMRDQVHYKLPFGPLGALVHALFVKKQLEGIFVYRQQVLEKRFGKFINR